MLERIKQEMTDRFFIFLRAEILEKAYRTGNMYRAVKKDPRTMVVWIDERQAPYAFYVNYGTRYKPGKFFVEQAIQRFEDFLRSPQWKEFLETQLEIFLREGIRR